MGTLPEMDIGGQAPQTDGQGSRAVTGLPLTKPGRWGLHGKSEGALSLSSVWSRLSHFTSSCSQTEKQGGGGGGVGRDVGTHLLFLISSEDRDLQLDSKKYCTFPG